MKEQKTISSSFMANLWQNSFAHKILSKVGRSLIKGLNNSFFIFKLLNDEKIYGSDGNLANVVGKTKLKFYKLFKAIKNLFSKAFTESYLVSGIREISLEINSDSYRFLFIVSGTALFSYGVISLMKGIYSMKRVLFFMALGILPLILGFLNVEIDTIFMESKFVKLIKKIFDYNS
jgi:hypothetical protein